MLRQLIATLSIREGFRNEVLKNLRNINRLLDSKEEADQFCELIVGTAAAGIKADRLLLAMKDEISGEFVIRAQRGDCKQVWGELSEQLTAIGEPVLLTENSRKHLRIRRKMTEAGISALLCIPLLARGRILGVMTCINEAKGAHFTTSDLNFASLLGWSSSMVLDNMQLLDKVNKGRVHTDQLLQELAFAQQNERRRVAIEIHDGVAQWMVGASFAVKTCMALISELKLANLEAELAKIRETIQKSVRELRRAIANLSPFSLAEAGLVPAIQKSAEVLQEEGIICHIDIEGILPELTSAEETTIYWIVQEVLSNIRGHSNASEVSIRMQSRSDTVSVEIDDDGEGFSPDEALKSAISSGHMGIMGMQERAKLSQGSRASILTRRQTEILKLIAEGVGGKEIGNQLFISPSTVKREIRNILAKLGVSDRAQAVSTAIKRKLI